MSTLYGSLYLFWNLKKVPEKDNVLWPYHVSKSCISNFCLFVCLFKGLDSVSGSPEPQHVSYYWTKISSWLLDAGKEQWGQEGVIGTCSLSLVLGESHKKIEPLNLLSAFESFHSSLSFYFKYYWLLPSRLYSQNYHQIFFWGRSKKYWPYRR